MENYFPTNLKYLRNKFNFTQEELAKKMDKDYSTIGKWELGQRNPIMADMIKLSEIFSIPVQDLIKNDLRLEDNSKKFNELDELGILLSSKIKDLPEDKQRLIINVTKSIIEEVDKELDGE